MKTLTEQLEQLVTASFTGDVKLINHVIDQIIQAVKERDAYCLPKLVYEASDDYKEGFDDAIEEVGKRQEETL